MVQPYLPILSLEESLIKHGPFAEQQQEDVHGKLNGRRVEKFSEASLTRESVSCFVCESRSSELEENSKTDTLIQISKLGVNQILNYAEIIDIYSESGTKIQREQFRYDEDGKWFHMIIRDEEEGKLEIFVVPSNEEFHQLSNEINDLQVLRIQETLVSSLKKEIILLQPDTTGFDPNHDLNWWRTIYHGLGERLDKQTLEMVFEEGYIYSIIRQKLNSGFHKDLLTSYLKILHVEHPEIFQLGRIYQQLKILEEKLSQENNDIPVVSSFLDCATVCLSYSINVSFQEYFKESEKQIEYPFWKAVRGEIENLVKYSNKILAFYKCPLSI
jgi:hypothetical protein